MPSAIPIFLFATGVQILQARGAARDRQRAERVAQRRADLATQRERIKNVRRGRIQRAQAESSGTSGEGTGGSGLQGTTQGLFQQQATNLAFLDQTQRFSQQISSLNISASKKQSNANTLGSIAGVAGDFDDLFGPSDSN